jgi:SPOR domain
MNKIKTIFSLLLLCHVANSFAFNSIVLDSVKSVIVIKDERLSALDKRLEALQLLAENLVKKEEVVEKDVAPTYSAIQAGKKTVTGSITQRQGFRVQIYNGADRAVAMKIKTEFNRAYPGMRSYMNYSIPNFKIKVGDFETKKEATSFLNKIKAIVPNAFIVPDVVTVKNIIVR